MKLELNGFAIEIDTNETSLMVKVMDASEKVLSDNTYEQTSTEQVTDVTETPVEEVTPQAEETTDTTTTTEEKPSGETTTTTEEETKVEEMMMPTFEAFKKLK